MIIHRDLKLENCLVSSGAGGSRCGLGQVWGAWIGDRGWVGDGGDDSGGDGL